MKNIDLFEVKGGTNISGTFINSIAKIISSFLEIGRTIGTALRMIKSGRKC